VSSAPQAVRAAKYDVAAFKPGGIAEFDPQSDTAMACAKRLVRYITSASTVRAYLVNEFGPHAPPSLRCIQSMIDAVRAPPPEPSAFAAEQFYTPRRDDGVSYQPRAVAVPIAPSPRAVAVPIAPRRAPAPPVDAPTPEPGLLRVTPRSDLLTVTDVARAVARAFGVTAAELTGPRRGKRVVTPRYVLVALLVARGASLSAAARHSGRKDHTTAIYALTRFFTRDLAASPVARQVWEALRPDDVAHCRTSAELIVAVRARRQGDG
jgi:hypothetical protein